MEHEFPTYPTITPEVMLLFADEWRADKWLADKAWPDGKPICPYCERPDAVNILCPVPLRCRCNRCYKYFSVRTRTIYAGSKVPLGKWLHARMIVKHNLGLHHANPHLVKMVRGRLPVEHRTAVCMIRDLRMDLEHTAALRRSRLNIPTSPF